MIQRERLVESLVEKGAIRTPWVRDAFGSVPREVFVPRFHKRSSEEDVWVDGTDPEQYTEWLSGVYDDVPLVTQATPASDIVSPAGLPTSSSSMPTVMAEMLEALGLQPGHRVLEIGTGTGYNAALLCHRVGADNVVSVELHPQLADAGRVALASVGLHPTIINGDGATAHAPDGSFDRIIATAAVDHIPPAWIDQLAPGGAIVTDLRGSLSGGLIRLATTGDGIASGRFLDIPGAFMPLRTRLDSPHRDGESWDKPLNTMNPHHGFTTTDPRAIASTPSLRFITQMHLAGHHVRGFIPDPDGSELSGHTTDASWFSVGLTADAEGLYPVLQGGPQRIWDTVECAYATWQRLGRPDIARYGVTAYDHVAMQHIWIDRPESSTRWPLPL